jgi:hypothetical protein
VRPARLRGRSRAHLEGVEAGLVELLVEHERLVRALLDLGLQRAELVHLPGQETAEKGR